jgi:integrase
MTKPQREHRAREIIQESGADSAACLQQSIVANLGTTFRQQAAWWIRNVQQRKRRPVKKRTAKTWESHLVWINPRIGDTPLSEVNNLVLRDLVEQMSEAGFTPKTILNYCYVVKAVVASAIGKDGEPLYPRTWNHEFMDLPEIDDQLRPTFTAAEIVRIISQANEQHAMLYVLLATAGLRVGEALALKVEHFQDGALLIRHSNWNGQITSPKTRFGVREVDLYSTVQDLLTAFVGNRKEGFIFQTEKGTALSQRNILSRSLHPILNAMNWKWKQGEREIETAGFHALRRFRVTHLRKQRTQEDLLRFWIGQGDKSVTDRYSKLRDDLEFRKAEVERVGIGINLGSCPFKSPELLLVN